MSLQYQLAKSHSEARPRGCGEVGHLRAPAVRDRRRRGSWWEIDNLAASHPKLGLDPSEEKELVAWLDEALDACAIMANPERFDPHMALDVTEALIRRHGPKERELGLDALRKAGAAFEGLLAKADGMLAGSWLQSISQRYRLAGLGEDANRVDLMILARSRSESEKWPAAPLAAASVVEMEPLDMQSLGMAQATGHSPQPATDRDDFIISKLTEKSGIDSLEKIARHLMVPEGHLRASEIASAERLAMPDLFPREGGPRRIHDGHHRAGGAGFGGADGLLRGAPHRVEVPGVGWSAKGCGN